MSGGKRGRPRKNQVAAPTVSPYVKEIDDALNGLALARDYAAVIASGSEQRQDLPELAEGARKAINEAGAKLEGALRDLKIIEEAPGWFEAVA